MTSDEVAKPSAGGQGDEYVNYLRVPVRVRRFVRIVSPVLVVLVAVSGVVLAFSQRSSGSAVWEDTKVRSMSGVIVARPYPMLWTSDADDSTPRLVLLVEEGKHGAARASRLDGQLVRASGHVLRRNGRMMLELRPGADGLVAMEGGERPPTPMRIEGRQVALRGEIVDAKCYLGAMKPGTGKTHKECAALCVRGGIPAVLVVREGDRTTEYLVESESGGAIEPGLIRWIGESVELTGTTRRLGDWDVLAAKSDGVRRP